MQIFFLWNVKSLVLKYNKNHIMIALCLSPILITNCYFILLVHVSSKIMTQWLLMC